MEKRYHIQAYKEAGFSKTEIAKKLNAHPSTIGRELKRNSSKIYRRGLLTRASISNTSFEI